MSNTLSSIRFVSRQFDHNIADLGIVTDELGRLANVADAQALRQSLMLLLATRPGERVMRPGYGCDLQELMFYPLNESTEGLAIHYVRRAITLWEPRVEIERLDAFASPDYEGCLEIQLCYRSRLSGVQDTMRLAMALME
ncbi:MAG: GPW/gp25 family protein [Pseudomonadota bacterium]